jgi:methionyl aminopeptidase
MSIKSNAEFEKMRAIGGIVAQALRAMTAQVRPGITTAELNAVGARVLAMHDARSAPPLVYGFPAEVCISIMTKPCTVFPGRA